jgi:hypothetical protein
MTNLTNALGQLQEERNQAQAQLEKLNSAISVLEGLVGRNGASVSPSDRKRRVVSAAARRRMAVAQRARWAKVRQQAATSHNNKPGPRTMPERILSAAARRKIAAAQKARWARVKAQQTRKAA